jgi:uncharacterized membrane protein
MNPTLTMNFKCDRSLMISGVDVDVDVVIHRYIATAVVINKTRKNMLKDVVKILISEQKQYSDPITDFVVAVYSDFDLDRAQILLPQCMKVVETDFFLGQAGEDSHMAEQVKAVDCDMT